MLQADAHTMAANNRLNAHRLTKYMNLSIQLTNENWLLRMCRHIVIVPYSVTFTHYATEGKFTSLVFLCNKEMFDSLMYFLFHLLYS